MPTTTTLIFGEGSQFFIQIPSCHTQHVLAYALLTISAMLLTWFSLTLATTKPPFSEVPSNQSPYSFDSDACTLIEKDVVAPKEAHCDSEEAKQSDSGEFITFNNPFADVSSPVKLSRRPSLALHPFVRRLSMPGREPSATPTHSFHHVVTPLCQRPTSLQRHGSLDDDGESYFPLPHRSSGKARVIPDDHNEKERATWETSQMKSPVLKRAISIASITSTKKVSKVKHVAKKVTAFLHLPHRS